LLPHAVGNIHQEDDRQLIRCLDDLAPANANTSKSVIIDRKIRMLMSLARR